MRHVTLPGLLLVFVGLLSSLGQTAAAQSAVENSASRAAVPLFVKISSAVVELNGTPSSGLQKLTFSLYGQQTGGSPLWSETQTVAVRTPEAVTRFCWDRQVRWEFLRPHLLPANRDGSE
jgi:hypothetical protein